MTKQPLPNQHDYLHPFYGADNCCLCKAEFRIQELERQVAELRGEGTSIINYRVIEETQLKDYEI